MAQAEGVYVQGAFDLFNPGDVAFLESAAALGERLVVGVLSDADVARSSGNPFLPIIPMHERALALLSQRAVDDVLLAPPLELTTEFLEEHGLATVAADPRDQGRYALPERALAAAEQAGLVVTPALPPLSVGVGDGEGGHLTSEGVLARQASAAAAAAPTTSLHTDGSWTASGLFPSSVVGSLPRPEFVRELVLAEGDDERRAARLHAAIKSAVAMQLQAGCDVVTDGELGRLSYIGIIAELAHGFEISQTPDGEEGRLQASLLAGLRPHTGVVALQAGRTRW